MTAYKQLNYTADEIDDAVGTLNAAMDDMEQNTANALIGTASGEIIGLKDVEDIEHEIGVKVWGTNIFDASKIVLGGLVGNTGADWDTNDNVRSDYLKVEPNTIYNFGGGSYTWNRHHAYDKDKNWISQIVLISNGKIRTPENTAFVRFAFVKPDRTAFTNEEIEAFRQEQLWVSSTATAYTPYIEDISAVTVNKFGKNLYAEGDQIFTRQKRIDLTYPLRAGTYTISAVFNNDSSSFNSGLIFYARQPATPGGGGSSIGNLSFAKGGRTSKTFTVNEDVYQLVFYATNASSTNEGVQASFTDIQIEAGGAFTGLEPYIEPVEYPVNTDGTVEGVTSLSPNMTLMTDTAGAVIDCEYHRDINMAFNELTQALIAVNAL